MAVAFSYNDITFLEMPLPIKNILSDTPLIQPGNDMIMTICSQLILVIWRKSSEPFIKVTVFLSL